MNKAATTMGQVQCRVGQFSHQLGPKPALFFSFSSVWNRRKEQNSGVLQFSPHPWIMPAQEKQSGESQVSYPGNSGFIETNLQKWAPRYTFSKSKVFSMSPWTPVCRAKEDSPCQMLSEERQNVQFIQCSFIHISPGDLLWVQTTTSLCWWGNTPDQHLDKKPTGARVPAQQEWQLIA